MNDFQRDLDAAAERARRFFADVRDADRRPGDLATAALSLSQELISLAFRSERSAKTDALPTAETPDADEPTILRFDAFRPTPRVAAVPQPEPNRAPTLKIFAADVEPSRRAAFPRLFVPADERPRLRVVAAD